jgi:hypothetical protein
VGLIAAATDPPSRVDFETLGEVIRSLSEIMGKRVTFEDLLEYDPRS